MLGGRYTGEEEELFNSSNITAWNINFVRVLLDAVKNRKSIWRREGYGNEFSTTLLVDSEIYTLRFGSVANRARKPPTVNFLKIIFKLGDITMLEPDQAKGFIITEYANDAEANLACLMRELGSCIEKQVKANEVLIKKDTGTILQRISAALQ